MVGHYIAAYRNEILKVVLKKDLLQQEPSDFKQN